MHQTSILFVLLLVILIGLIWRMGLSLSNYYANLFLKKGQGYFQQREYITAITKYTWALRLNARLTVGYIGRASAYVKTGFWDKAILDANQALKLNVKEAVIYLIRGCAYLHESQGQVRAALADFNRALTLDPKHLGVHYYRGVAHQILGDQKSALMDFETELNLTIEAPFPSIFNPEDIYFHRGFSYYHLGQYEHAISELNIASSFAPEINDVYYIRAVARTYQGDLQGALEDFTMVLENTPVWDSSNHRYNRGVVQYLLGNYSQAASDFTHTLKIDPEMVSAYYWRGHTYYELNDKQGAIKDYNQAQGYPNHISPDDQHGYYARGLAHMRLDDIEVAIADLEKALQIASDHRDVAFQGLVGEALKQVWPPR